MIKTGFNILSNAIKFAPDLYINEENVDFLVQLLKIWLHLLKDKSELQLDFEAGNKAVGYLFN